MISIELSVILVHREWMPVNLAESRIRILFPSLSNKIALYQKVLEATRRVNPRGMVFGADCKSDCEGARVIGKEFFLKMEELADYSHESMMEFLERNKISHVIPTRDGELEFWAKFNAKLTDNKIRVMVSNEDSLKLCDDKLKFFHLCKNFEISAILTAPSIDFIESERVVVKERFGSGSKNIGLNLTPINAIAHSRKLDDPVFQPYIEGREFSAETWLDEKGKCRGVVLRWRVKVVGGESHETTTFKNEEWENLLTNTFEEISGLRGHCLAQVIVDHNKYLNLVEINPRLGGASPLSLDSGLASVDWFLRESLGQKDLIPQKAEITIGKSLIKSNGKIEILDPQNYMDECNHF